MVIVGVAPALTTVLCVLDTEHVPVPLQPPPLHPANTLPDAGVAVSVTVELKFALQVAPHEIPAALLATVPVPVPVFDTLTVNVPPPLVVKVWTGEVNVPSVV